MDVFTSVGGCWFGSSTPALQQRILRNAVNCFRVDGQNIAKMYHSDTINVESALSGR